jgi:hypothetical protein
VSSTQITVENRTDVPIYALLLWAGGHIGGVVVQPAAGATYSSGNIPCEYVWYDFWVLDPRQGLTRDGEVGGGVIGGHTLAKKQARGSTSWIFQRSGEQYELVER